MLEEFLESNSPGSSSAIIIINSEIVVFWIILATEQRKLPSTNFDNVIRSKDAIASVCSLQEFQVDPLCSTKEALTQSLQLLVDSEYAILI